MTDDDGARPADAGAAAFAAALSEGLAAHFERLAPLADLLLEAAEVPLDPGGGHNPCWCRCGPAHPGDDVCDMEAVVTRRIGHAAGEWVDVPVCAPCAVAHATAAQG
jgi:hypothetical protein